MGNQIYGAYLLSNSISPQDFTLKLMREVKEKYQGALLPSVIDGDNVTFIALDEVAFKSPFSGDTEILVKGESVSFTTSFKEVTAIANGISELYKMAGEAQSTGMTLSALAREIPGIDQVVPYPCKCDNHTSYIYRKVIKGEIRSIIIHLNDEMKWSREQIADWLDTLDNPPTFTPQEKETTSELF